MMAYLWLLLVSVLTCAGQLCQKQAAHCWLQVTLPRRGQRTLSWLALAVVLLAVGMCLWLGVLQRLPLSVAYPMLSINFVLVTLTASLLFGESINRRHWLGVAFIMLGILLMSVNL